MPSAGGTFQRAILHSGSWRKHLTPAARRCRGRTVAVGCPCDTRPVRRLVLIRHAKAADGDLDRRRRLTPEGTAAAESIGRYLADHEPSPDRVVTSPARRAAETWAAAARALTDPPAPDEDERIYDNTVDALQEVVRDTPPDVGILVVVGHNPSMHALAQATDDGTGDPKLRKTLAERFPTAAVAVFDISEDWATLDQGTLSGLHLKSR